MTSLKRSKNTFRVQGMPLGVLILVSKFLTTLPFKAQARQFRFHATSA